MEGAIPPTPLMEPPGHHPIPRDFLSALNFSYTYPAPSTLPGHAPDASFQYGLLGRSLAIIKCLAQFSLSAPSFCHAGPAQREWIQPEDSPPA